MVLYYFALCGWWHHNIVHVVIHACSFACTSASMLYSCYWTNTTKKFCFCIWLLHHIPPCTHAGPDTVTCTGDILLPSTKASVVSSLPAAGGGCVSGGFPLATSMCVCVCVRTHVVCYCMTFMYMQFSYDN